MRSVIFAVSTALTVLLSACTGAASSVPVNTGFFGFGQHIHHDLVRSGFGCFGECFFGNRKHPDWACPGADIGQH